MTVAVDKSDNKSAANHYYENTTYKFRKSSITGVNELNLMNNVNYPSINLRLGPCSFIQMFPVTLEQIWSVVNKVYSGNAIPIEPSTLQDYEVVINFYQSEKFLFEILNQNALERLLSIKWSNEVLKKLWWVDTNNVPKLRNLLVVGTLTTSLASIWKPIFYITSLKVFLEFLTGVTPDFCVGEF